MPRFRICCATAAAAVLIAVTGCEDNRGKVSYPPPEPRPENLKVEMFGAPPARPKGESAPETPKPPAKESTPAKDDAPK